MADGEDLMAQLPEHLSIRILELLDAETLFNFTKVNTAWNAITDRLHPRIWFNGCLNAGIDVEEVTYNFDSEWKAFFLTMVQRLRDMRTCRCYGPFHYTLLQPAKAVSCDKEKLAIAFSDYVVIMDTWHNIVECIWRLPNCFETSFLKLDGNTLIAASTNGHILHFPEELEIGFEIRPPIVLQFILLSIDFLTAHSILVESVRLHSTPIIYIWRIFGDGRYHKIIVDETIHRVILAPNPAGDHERKTYFLLGLSEDFVRVWKVEISSQPFTVPYFTSVRIPFLRNIHGDAADSPPFGLLFDGTELFFMAPSTENSRIICAWNFRQRKLRHFQSEHPIINLLGVGKKYLVYKFRPIHEREDIVCAVDKITERFVAHIRAPRIPSGNSFISLGNTSWMDGLNGNNDIGLVFASLNAEDTLKLDFVQYGPRH